MRRVWPPGSAGSHSLLVATSVILFKGYFLCVVWKCYRYLKMREMILPLTLSFPASVVGPEMVLPAGFMPPPTTVTISPPDYETATKGSSAPPDYETAIRQQDSKTPESPAPTPQSPSSSSATSDQSHGSQAEEAVDATVIQIQVTETPDEREGRSQRETQEQRTTGPVTQSVDEGKADA